MMEVFRCLAGDGFEFHAYAPRRGKLWDALDPFVASRTPFERVREPVGENSPAELTALALADCIGRSETPVDLLHGNSLSTAHFTGLAGKRLGIPAMAHVREIERLNPTRARRLNENLRLVAVSRAVAENLVACGVDAERVEVVYNGVNLEAVHPDRIGGTIRVELDIPCDAPLIAVVGQISLRKATDVFFEAVKLLVRRVPELHGLVVGERFSQKAEAVELEERIKVGICDEGFAEQVHCLGWREDVLHILRDLDLLVQPSRQEPLGRVILESAALGVPCVATDVGGSGEIVEHGQSGWLVPVDDPKALARAIERALVDQQELLAAGREARRVAEEKFPAETCAQRIALIYRALLSG